MICEAKKNLSASNWSLEKVWTRYWHKQIRHIAGLTRQSGLILNSDKLPVETANDLNRHFAGICSSLPPLNLEKLVSYLPASSPPPQVLRFQVFKRLSKLNTSKSSHPSTGFKRVCLWNIGSSHSYYWYTWKEASVGAGPKVILVHNFDQLRHISIIFACAFKGTVYFSWMGSWWH